MIMINAVTMKMNFLKVDSDGSDEDEEIATPESKKGRFDK
jgi:hypothetical protein